MQIQDRYCELQRPFYVKPTLPSSLEGRDELGVNRGAEHPLPAAFPSREKIHDKDSVF